MTRPRAGGSSADAVDRAGGEDSRGSSASSAPARPSWAFRYPFSRRGADGRSARTNQELVMTTLKQLLIAGAVPLIALLFSCDKPATQSDGSSPSGQNAGSPAQSDLKWWAITEIAPNGNLICNIYAFGPGSFVYEGAPRAD